MAQRSKIIQRKSKLDDRISDIMSFISNSENIWEFLRNEIDMRQYRKKMCLALEHKKT